MKKILNSFLLPDSELDELNGNLQRLSPLERRILNKKNKEQQDQLNIVTNPSVSEFTKVTDVSKSVRVHPPNLNLTQSPSKSSSRVASNQNSHRNDQRSRSQLNSSQNSNNGQMILMGEQKLTSQESVNSLTNDNDGEPRKFIDPMLSFKALADAKFIDYYSTKIAAPRNKISPVYTKGEKEIAKEDPFSVLTRSQRTKMNAVRQSNKQALHYSAV